MPAVPDGLSRDDDGIRPIRQALAGERSEKLGLAVAGNARDADDLAGPGREVDITQRLAVQPGGRHGKSRDPEHLAFRVVRRIGADLADLAADHEGCDLAGAAGAGIDGGDHAPGPQDRGAAAETAHLLQLVGDVEDRAALGREPVERREQMLGLLRREHGGRLVEDQQARVLEKAADDLDALPLAGRQGPDRPVGIERQTVGAADLTELAADGREVPVAGERDRDVLGHRQLVEEREVLEHHPEAEISRLDGRGDGHRAPFPADLAGARLDDAVEDLHQRRLAGTVLPEKRVDLARLDRKIDPVIGEKVAIALADPFKLDEGRPRG